MNDALPSTWVGQEVCFLCISDTSNIVNNTFIGAANEIVKNVAKSFAEIFCKPIKPGIVIAGF